MRSYELICIVHPQVDGEALTAVIETVKGLVERNGGKVTDVEPWGLRRLAYPIRNSSQANGIVLDTFGGSGSTLIACEQTDRICCMMELDEKYASVILRRYAEFKGNDEDITCERGGKTFAYADLVKEVAGRG